MPISSSAPYQSTIPANSDGLDPPVESAEDHVLIGSAGPDKREMEGIQRALDLLREKRSPDYGWENDTHMVILAKEVCNTRKNFLNILSRILLYIYLRTAIWRS